MESPKRTGSFFLTLLLIVVFISAPVFAAELMYKSISPGAGHSSYAESLAKKESIVGDSDDAIKLSAPVNGTLSSKMLTYVQAFLNMQKARLSKIHNWTQTFVAVQKSQLAKRRVLAKVDAAVQKAEASYDMGDIAEAQNLIIDLPEQTDRDALNARIHRILSGDLPDIYGEDFTSHTPTPDLWALIDRVGVTPEMIAADKDDGTMSHSVWGTPDNLGSGQYDFITVDFYTSSQPDYTYWSLFQWYMDMSKYKRAQGYDFTEDMDGYAGLQSISDGETTAITSMWQSEADNGDILTPTCIYPSEFSDSFDHEGSGTAVVINHNWQANRWYRFVLRSYADENDTTTYISSYVMDLETEEVTLIAIYDTHLPKSSMRGPGPFLENYSEESYFYHRDMYMTNFYARDVHSQEWLSLNTGKLIIGGIGDHQGSYRFSAGNGILRVETCGIGKDVIQNNDYDATEWKYRLSQPRIPKIDEDLFPIHINE